MNATITIVNPKSISREKEFVLIPKKEYEVLRKSAVPVVMLTAREREAVARGEREHARCEYITLDRLAYELRGARAKKR